MSAGRADKRKGVVKAECNSDRGADFPEQIMQISCLDDPLSAKGAEVNT
jgi:hypothetical protein